MSTPLLSILIATTPDRRPLFTPLWNELVDQARTLEQHDGPLDIHGGAIGSVVIGRVEIHWHEDSRELSIGAKRQAMVEAARGEYVAHFDSDDWPHHEYLAKIIEALQTRPDCVGFYVEVHGLNGGRRVERAIASNRFARWCSKCKGHDYVRTIYHKNPVKREHALAVGFKDMRFGEDHDYSIRLKAAGILKDEVFIDQALYVYRYKAQPHSIKFGVK